MSLVIQGLDLNRLAPNSISQHGVDVWDVADYLVNCLESLGVEAVFGVPGGAIEPFVNALARSDRRGRIRTVITRHEASAAYAAQGYSRESGKLGVCFTTTGPGATNALTAVASAYWDEVPMLIVTGQTILKNRGKAALQDSSLSGVDVIGIFKHCTRYNALIDDVTQFERQFRQAVLATNGDPPGPAHLSISPDVLRRKIGGNKPAWVLNHFRRKFSADMAHIRELQRLLEKSEKTLVLIGEGCGESIPGILKFIEEHCFEFATTPGAKGLIRHDHPLYVGVFGFAGHEKTREIFTNPFVDLIIAIGTRFGEWDSLSSSDTVQLAGKWVHIDDVNEHFWYTPDSKLCVYGTIKYVFDELNKFEHECYCDSQMLSNHRSNSYYSEGDTNIFNSIRDNGIPPAKFMNWLSYNLPSTSCIYVDAGNSTSWGVHYLRNYFSSARRRDDGDSVWFRMSSQFAAMGWAIGNVIGAAVGSPKRKFVCITGDGSWLMNGQEFTVSVAEKLSIIYIVLNDSAYGMVKHGQRLSDAERFGFELPAINYCAIAQAMGGMGIRVEKMEQLEDIVPLLESLEGPLLLDVVIDGEAVPPMGARVKVLGEAA